MRIDCFIRFVVGDAMPKVDYRTLVDIYVDTCFYLQVLTMLANAGQCQCRVVDGLHDAMNSFKN